jgi:proteasome component ECM29
MQAPSGKVHSAAAGALATYKDLCTLATSLERPQLLYALIDVATEATPHAARRGSLLGARASSSVAASRALLQAHASALLPKLYRGSCAPPLALAPCMLRTRR